LVASQILLGLLLFVNHSVKYISANSVVIINNNRPTSTDAFIAFKKESTHLAYGEITNMLQTIMNINHVFTRGISTTSAVVFCKLPTCKK
jgi:hypothetical protein